MNANKLFSEFSIKKIWDKLLQHDKAMSSTLLILSSGNWTEQEDGTFKNTVEYSTFKNTDKLTVDLYDDGTLTDTILTEYESYIDSFEIINGGLVAIANTKPSQTMTLVVKGEFEVNEIGVDELAVKVNELNSNLPFKLGIDESGNYGYIKDGADTVIPFKSGVMTETELNGIRSEIIAPLKNASPDINDDSSFSDIVNILWDLYPNEILMKLYSAGANTGNFAQFGSNGVSSVSIGSSSIGLTSRYDEDAIGQVGIITASKYNLDKLTKLTITYSASSTISKSTAPYVAYVKIGLFKNKSFSDPEAIIFTLANNFASASGTIINDISDVSGEYYIGVMIHAPYYYKETTSCSITEITLSNY